MSSDPTKSFRMTILFGADITEVSETVAMRNQAISKRRTALQCTNQGFQNWTLWIALSWSTLQTSSFPLPCDPLALDRQATCPHRCEYAVLFVDHEMFETIGRTSHARTLWPFEIPSHCEQILESHSPVRLSSRVACKT